MGSLLKMWVLSALLFVFGLLWAASGAIPETTLIFVFNDLRVPERLLTAPSNVLPRLDSNRLRRSMAQSTGPLAALCYIERNRSRAAGKRPRPVF